MATANFPTLALGTTLGVQVLVAMSALAIPAIAPAVAADTHLAVTLIGLFIAIMYIGAMTASIGSGGAIVRYGSVRMSQFCLLGCACGLLLTACGTRPTFMAGAFLIGLGYGTATPASSHLLAREVPGHWRSLVFSLKQTGVPLGGMLAGLLLPSTVLLVGWRGSLPLLAAACVACAALIQPTRARFDAARERGQSISAAVAVHTIRLVLTQAPIRALAICTFFFATMQSSLATYLVTQLHEAASFSLVTAGFVLALAQAAAVVGRILWGYLADRWVRPGLMLALLALAMGSFACIQSAVGPDWPLWLVAALAIPFGATTTGWNGVYLAEVARLAPVGQAGVVTGGTLFFTFSGTVIAPTLFAAVAAHTGSIGSGYLTLGVIVVVFGIFLLWRQRSVSSLPPSSGSAA